jgi:protein-S-isoprenylcysteine O-methyltransferase Ste14
MNIEKKIQQWQSGTIYLYFNFIFLGLQLSKFVLKRKENQQSVVVTEKQNVVLIQLGVYRIINHHFIITT